MSKKAYWASVYRAVHKPENLAEYAKLAGPAITAAGGKFLARGIPSAVKEAGLMERFVLIEFPSVAAAEAAYVSEGYKAALAALGTDAVERDVRIIEAAQ